MPRGAVSVENAYAFGVVASVLSVLLLALASNYLAAGLLAFSIFFYSVIYTMILKRSHAAEYRDRWRRRRRSRR